MKPPIYVYYELDNYYQNHRRYVKSRSSLQLLGEVCRLIDERFPHFVAATDRLLLL